MERITRQLTRLAASLTALGLGAVLFFIALSALPALTQIPLNQLLFGRVWAPTHGLFGLLPMLIGSAKVVLLALALAVPLGLLLALFLAYFAPRGLRAIFAPVLDLLAAVPSVIYGFFGVTLLVPLVRRLYPWADLPLLAAAPVLALMVLPTLVQVAHAALQRVPADLWQGALALGASRWQAAWGVALPAARSGVAAALVLALGRALGETMVVLMLTEGAAWLSLRPGDPLRPLTAHIALEMDEAVGLHRSALLAAGLVLLLVVLIVNLWLNRLAGKGERL